MQKASPVVQPILVIAVPGYLPIDISGHAEVSNFAGPTWSFSS